MTQMTTRQLFYRLSELVPATQLSRSTLLRLIQQGKFPRPIKLGDRAIRFDAGEVEEWLKARKESRQ